MKKTSVVVGSIVLSIGVLAACNGATEVPVVQNGAQNLHAIDAGTGKCGSAPCGDGELCCESADESCTPTCTKVASCPVYGRPCKIEVDAGPGPGVDAGGGGTNLHWYETCGAPVCQSPTEDAGAPVDCPKLGTACTEKGATCGNPNLNCGAVAVCDDHDPKGGFGGCPISTKKFKQEIGYVDDAALQRLHDETLQMRLATYRYKGPFVDPQDPNAKHLGFIIEDQPQSMSVDRGHDRVDLYGYMSMAVATMQVQEKEIAQLKRDLAEVKATCKR